MNEEYPYKEYGKSLVKNKCKISKLIIDYYTLDRSKSKLFFDDTLEDEYKEMLNDPQKIIKIYLRKLRRKQKIDMGYYYGYFESEIGTIEGIEAPVVVVIMCSQPKIG